MQTQSVSPEPAYRKIKSPALFSSLINIDDRLPDCTENPFGAHTDLIFISISAKRLKGKAGAKDANWVKDDSPFLIDDMQ